MRTPNLNSLRMFDAAARHLNFRRAAEELSLTQGAVAQQVRQLEKNLGLQLFRRKARGLTLTDIGRSYHLSVSRGLGIIDEATAKLKPPSTQIILSVTPSFASKWLVPRLTAFSRSHPNIQLQTVASEELTNFVTDNVDIAIRQGSPASGNAYETVQLAQQKLCAVCSPEYAALLPDIQRIDECSLFDLVQDAHKHWEILLEEKNVSPKNGILQFNQTSLAIDAAVNGQGIALAPRILVSNDLADGKLQSVWQDARTDQGGFYLLYPRTHQSHIARDAVVSWLSSEIDKTC